MITIRLAVLLSALVALTAVASLTGCSTSRPAGSVRAADIAKVDARVETTPDGTSTAHTLTAYKEEIARRVS